MKFTLGALFLVVLFVFCISPFEVEATEDKETIKVGYYSLYTDFIDDLDNINAPGYGYEIFEKIEQITNLEFEYVPIDSDLIEAVEDGVVDVAGFLTRTDLRRESVAYSRTPYGKTYVALTTDDGSITYNTPEVIDGKTVATFPDNYAQQYLVNYCERNNISVEFIYGDVSNYTELDADFYITFSEDRKSIDQNNILNLGVFNLFVVGDLENPEKLEKIDAGFSQIINSEGNYFLELEEKYLSDNLEMNHRSLTQNEIDILRQRPLEVGYIADYQPISFTNENGEPDGSLIEIFDTFSERYGFEVNYHPYSVSDDSYTNVQYDVLLTLYGSGEYENENYVTTESLISIAMYAQVYQESYLKSSSFGDMVSKSPRIGVLPYQLIDYDGIIEGTNSEFVVYYDWHELLDDFESRELDMIIHTESATAYAELYLEGSGRVAVHTDVDNPIKLFVSKEISDVYVPIFNVMIDRLTQNEYEDILVSHSSLYYPEKSFFDVVMDYWQYLAIAVALALTAFVGYAFTKQKQKQFEITTAYNTDALTGLTAFHKFRDDVQEILGHANPNEYEMISFDVDMFKTINTHYSNERGTNIIKSIALALGKVFEDTSAVISRRTADQFLVFRKVNESGEIRQIYNKDILPKVREVIGENYNVSMSFGSVLISNPKEKVSTVIGHADNARVLGKQSHKTSFHTFDKKMQKQYDDKINITFRMEHALKDKEFYIEFQPKVSFDSLKVSGAEALVRWKPTFGDVIYPDQFIPVFEENGFIATLDLYVLEEVCKFISVNYKKMNIPRISVNLSAHTVLAENIVSRLTEIVKRYDISPQDIELELTESAIENDTSTFLLRVKQFKKLGFMISIDDFGAGVSSLNRLSAIEADVLKLDKAFFDLKDQGGKSVIVVADVVKMAKHLQMKVVAEGVETSAQALWLKNIKCDFAQGYYFSKSIGQKEFKELLISEKEFKISLA